MRLKIIISLVLIIFTFKNSFAQCTSSNPFSDCSKKHNIKSIYLRDFNSKLHNGNNYSQSWSVVLNKGITYRFYVCISHSYDEAVYLYLHEAHDMNKGWVYGFTNGKGGNDFDFLCKKSGIYYVTIKGKNDDFEENCCALGIQTFVGYKVVGNYKSKNTSFYVNDALKNNSAVKALILMGNNIDSLTIVNTEKLINIEFLGLSQLNLNTIPESIFFFKNLGLINLSFNELSYKEIFTLLENCSKIKFVDITGNNIYQEEYVKLKQEFKNVEIINKTIN